MCHVCQSQTPPWPGSAGRGTARDPEEDAGHTVTAVIGTAQKETGGALVDDPG